MFSSRLYSCTHIRVYMFHRTTFDNVFVESTILADVLIFGWSSCPKKGYPASKKSFVKDANLPTTAMSGRVGGETSVFNRETNVSIS